MDIQARRPDPELGAGHEAALVGREVDHRQGDVVDVAEAAKRDLPRELVLDGGAELLDERREYRRVDERQVHGVAPDGRLRPLTREQVESARDQAHRITKEPKDAQALERSLGYTDLNPELVWEQWQLVRERRSS